MEAIGTISLHRAPFCFCSAVIVFHVIMEDSALSLVLNVYAIFFVYKATLESLINL